MRCVVLLVTIALLHITVSGQNTIGIPNIVNYSKQVYNAGSQNWNIVQDKQGILYFANNDGLLSFDGVFWRTYKLPNRTIARSVAIGSDNRIYIGGQKEIGYFYPGANGELVYTSLNKLIPAKDNDFADVWNICFFNNHVFFRANRKILEYDGHKMIVHNSPNWGYLNAVAGELVAFEIDKGIVSFKNGQWQQRVNTGALPKDNIMIRSILPFGKDSMLVVSLMHGLFIIHHDTLSSFETPDIKSIASRNIAGACVLTNGRIALVTNLGGCNIIDKKGKFIQRFTKQEGIQNNNTLCAMMDRDQNLWLGLDNGIDLVTYSNAIKNIFPDKEDRNSGYTSVIHDNKLYLGVSTGVYKIALDSINKDISYTNGTFTFVENSKGQVWNLSEVNGRLLMGHNKGAYVVEDDKAIELYSKTGCWAFQALYNNTNPSPVVIAGTYSGINFYKYNNGISPASLTEKTFESARFIGIAKNVIWAAHPYKGIYKLQLNAAGDAIQVSKYDDKRNILSSNHNKVFQLHDRIILTTDKGIFEYNETLGDFERSEWFENLLGKTQVSYIREDKQGNIWFCSGRKVGVVDRSSATPKIVFIPEIDDRIISNGFENITIIDSNNVLIAAERGFFHINYAQYKKSKHPMLARIRKVQAPLQKDGLLYGGHNIQTEEPSIKHKYNSLHFECASGIFGQEQNTEYSYYLEGFDNDWSVWTRKTEKDYTNLPAGHYVFKVKCRNNFDNESPVSSYSFTILPPWYQTWWAYTLYAVAFFSLIYLFYKRQQRKYKRLQQIKLQEQQRKYDEEQKQLQLQHEIEIRESEKQIIELKNEKLQAEVEHKNSELATSAMNLVQKKEMLSKLKEDLVQYKENSDGDKAGKELQKILRTIDKELDHNEEWEQFAVHFDSVHTNYLKRLKEYCPELTASELKLAAYLRLSLSTKEIAQLMNISIRGVETSRYRLRKKLGLANETNLFDFLIRVTS
ncbi:MAG TPA: triple tyrosine motif-containing protein [Chitinophagaceae bacterium]|nr:triple tyrosine motif-containing protein [Chitinophagaceae bacterium]